MHCTHCDRAPLLSGLCQEHFLPYFEDKVRRTIDEHDLLRPGERMAVAVSGGKDSLTILTLLHAWGHDVTAIAIDEGIAGYRDRSLDEARRVCDGRGIPLLIRSFKDATGTTLDETLRERPSHPCTVCGTLRRRLLSVAAKDFDVIATGHNADDEAQAVLMNLIKGNTELFPRLGPSTPRADGFTRRVKPLYFCTEREVAAYAYLKGLAHDFSECPHVGRSYRRVIRDELNRYAQQRPGARERVLRRFLALRPERRDTALMRCAKCGEPSSKSPCRACLLTEAMTSINAVVRKR